MPPVAQQLRNIRTFYGTRRFITVFTRALHWSLSGAGSDVVSQWVKFRLSICPGFEVWSFQKHTCWVSYTPVGHSVIPPEIVTAANRLTLGMRGGLISLWLYEEVRKEVVVRRGQIRWEGWVFQNFKVKICQFLVRNGRLVSSSIVLKKQDCFRKTKTYQHPYV
jgi:hypothetical protein